jgi:hypothetical protein
MSALVGNNELESQKIDFDFQSLSPQHKANVIPYLINKLDNNLIVATPLFAVNFLNMHQFRQLTYWQV